jgi:hypothetical protein
MIRIVHPIADLNILISTSSSFDTRQIIVRDFCRTYERLMAARPGGKTRWQDRLMGDVAAGRKFHVEGKDFFLRRKLCCHLRFS